MITLSWNPPFDDNGEATMLITYFTRRFGKIIVDPKVYMFVLNRDDYAKFGEHHRFVTVDTALPGDDVHPVPGMIIGFLPTDHQYKHVQNIRHVSKTISQNMAWSKWKKLRRAGKIGPKIDGRIEKEIVYAQN